MGVFGVFTSSNEGLLAAAALLAVFGFLLSRLTRISVDPREPPVIHPKVPLIGHIIGLVRNGPLYFRSLGQTYKQHPAITLPILNSRTYLVLAPELAAQVQRASSTLDFTQLAVETLPRMCHYSKEAAAIIDDPQAKVEGRERMVTKVLHGLMTNLLSPQMIDGVANVQLKHFTDIINGLEDGFETDLYPFIKKEITLASMESFYGPENPMALHPELVEEFWNWEGGLVGLMMGVFPKWTARKAYNGLERCTRGFMEYIKEKRYTKAYELLQRRRQFHEDEGLSLEDQARCEVPMMLGINVNAGITAFWVLNNIYSRPSLLAEIREEIQSHALVEPDRISFSALRDKVPILNSIFRESMRVTAPMSSARYVKEDTLLADTWLLRKGTVVQIAGPVLHANKNIWGEDVESFNPRRFVYNQNGTKSSSDGSIVDAKANQVHPAAYRSFGGGSTLCPGRHFAQMEVLSLTAVILMGFDLEAPKGQDKVAWDPPMDDKRFPIAVIKPLTEVNVRFVRRPGMEDVKWKLEY